MRVFLERNLPALTTTAILLTCRIHFSLDRRAQLAIFVVMNILIEDEIASLSQMFSFVRLYSEKSVYKGCLKQRN